MADEVDTDRSDDSRSYRRTTSGSSEFSDGDDSRNSRRSESGDSKDKDYEYDSRNFRLSESGDSKDKDYESREENLFYTAYNPVTHPSASDTYNEPFWRKRPCLFGDSSQHEEVQKPPKKSFSFEIMTEKLVQCCKGFRNMAGNGEYVATDCARQSLDLLKGVMSSRLSRVEDLIALDNKAELLHEKETLLDDLKTVEIILEAHKNRVTELWDDLQEHFRNLAYPYNDPLEVMDQAEIDPMERSPLLMYVSCADAGVCIQFCGVCSQDVDQYGPIMANRAAAFRNKGSVAAFLAMFGACSALELQLQAMKNRVEFLNEDGVDAAQMEGQLKCLEEDTKALASFLKYRKSGSYPTHAPAAIVEELQSVRYPYGED